MNEIGNMQSTHDSVHVSSWAQVRTVLYRQVSDNVELRAWNDVYAPAVVEELWAMTRVAVYTDLLSDVTI